MENAEKSMNANETFSWSQFSGFLDNTPTPTHNATTGLLMYTHVLELPLQTCVECWSFIPASAATLRKQERPNVRSRPVKVRWILRQHQHRRPNRRDDWYGRPEKLAGRPLHIKIKSVYSSLQLFSVVMGWMTCCCQLEMDCK